MLKGDQSRISSIRGAADAFGPLYWPVRRGHFLDEPTDLPAVGRVDQQPDIVESVGPRHGIHRMTEGFLLQAGNRVQKRLQQSQTAFQVADPISAQELSLATVRRRGRRRATSLRQNGSVEPMVCRSIGGIGKWNGRSIDLQVSGRRPVLQIG